MGILLLRIGISAALIRVGIDGFLGAGLPTARLEPGTIAQDVIGTVIEGVGSLFLLAGLWTPAAGAMIVVDELWIAFSLCFSLRTGYWNHIFMALLTAGLAMIGPGAWSIDARLFGMTRFDIDRARGRKPSH